MAKKPLKIATIVSEVDPFSKSGGLADVVRSLPKAIKRLGHEMIIITPLYGKAIDKNKHNLKLINSNVTLRLNSKDRITVNYWKGYAMNDLPVYFVEYKPFFSQKKNLYQYPNDNARFMVFNVAALKLISLLKYEADIIHCHDWQTGLVPYYLKTLFKNSRTMQNSRTVFTIHNLIFQFGKNWWEVPVEKKDFGRKSLPHLDNPDVEYVNFAKRAILNADIINAVSEKYRDEIMTRKFGQDLHRILKNREDRLFGIVNGISYEFCNPNYDETLVRNYDYATRRRKKQNKEYIQKKFGLEIDSKMPIICTTSRITFQKGFDLITKIIGHILKLDVQMIMIGSGDPKFIKTLKKVAKKHPDQVAVIPSHDECLKNETLVFAGSDFFLLPSHYEPCGINQLKAMRYGAVPIVRKVGGLHDTVENYNPLTNRGTGFSFSAYNEYSLFGTIVRALETFKYKENWDGIVERCMKQSNSWEIPAKKYVTLYRKVMKMKR